MTTIIYKDGVLYSDSLVSNDHSRVGFTKKIGKIEGHLWGFAGSLQYTKTFAKWIELSLERTKGWTEPGSPWDENPPRWSSEHDGSIGVLVKPDGTVCEYLGEGWVFMEPLEFMAWGTGSTYALGALAAGATPEEALAIAMRYDVWTGGPMQTRALREDAQ